MRINKVEKPVDRFKYDWTPIVEYGHTHPGEWFEPDMVFKHSTYSALLRGKNSLFNPGEWEIKSYQTDWGEFSDGIRRVRLQFNYKGKRK